MWAGEARGLDGDGRRLAVQEEGAGGHHPLHLPQLQADLGGEAGAAGGDLYLAPTDGHHDVVAAGPPSV